MDICGSLSITPLCFPLPHLTPDFLLTSLVGFIQSTMNPCFKCQPGNGQVGFRTRFGITGVLIGPRCPGGLCFGAWVFNLFLGSWSSELILDLMHFNGWETRFRYEKLNVRALLFQNQRERRFSGEGGRQRLDYVLLMMVVGDVVGKERVY